MTGGKKIKKEKTEFGPMIVAKVDSGRYTAVIQKKKFVAGYGYRGLVFKNGDIGTARLQTDWTESMPDVFTEFRHIARSVLSKF